MSKSEYIDLIFNILLVVLIIISVILSVWYHFKGETLEAVYHIAWATLLAVLFTLSSERC